MIRISKPAERPESSTAWHAGFLAMLPRIRRQASLAFRDLPKATREDLIEEVVVSRSTGTSRSICWQAS